MNHELPPLPFSPEALEPSLSRETLEAHHDQHHRGYVDRLNQLIPGTELANLSLEGILRAAKRGHAIYNQAAQAWNHAFLWNCLGPRAQAREPRGELRRELEHRFGSLEDFRHRFEKAAADRFGSGWAWLTFDPQDGRLAIETSANGDNPIGLGGRLPLFTCDVWEHAYYLDYRHERSRYLASLWEVTNWAFVEQRFQDNRGVQAA